MEKITISKELCDYVESLHYETNALQDLLRKEGINNTSEELRSYWYTKYVETYTKYNLAKQELEDTYIVPQLGKNHNWNLDFSTCTLEVQ